MEPASSEQKRNHYRYVGTVENRAKNGKKYGTLL